jgi:hypothetical protein
MLAGDRATPNSNHFLDATWRASDGVSEIAKQKVVLGLQPAAILPSEFVEWSACGAARA